MPDPLLTRVARRQPVEHTPVWFMRQAGRSLPEYRRIRERYGLFDIVAEPELCAEVTLQPVRRHDVDAAVMFTDIMFPVLEMGVEVELVENVVPTIPFATGTATLLSTMADAGGDVIGLAWRIPLDRGWAEVGEDRGVQGNLDPAVLLGPWARIEAETRAILDRAAGRPGHVFNLGHGVMPDTDPAV